MTAGLRSFGALAACLVVLGPGHADAKTAGPSTQTAQATLHVTPGALGTPWTFELTNTDTTALRVVADGRLLTLDVTPGDPDDDDDEKTPARAPAKSRATVHCALPADVRPTTDSEAVTVLEPSATYVEEFDPRLYCFDGREAVALAPGARVVAHLGWPAQRTRAQTPPFIADESLGGDDRSGVKELTAEPVTTPEPLPADSPAETPRQVSVSAPARVDAATARELEIVVTVENTSSRPIRLVLRPETLAFEVASTKGVFQCSSHRYSSTAFAEIFTEVMPHTKASTSVLLSTLCPDDALRAAGLYTVRARIDTRHASGSSIGIESFDAIVLASAPTLVRIRHSTASAGPNIPLAWASSGSRPTRGAAPPRPITRRPGGIRH